MQRVEWLLKNQDSNKEWWVSTQPKLTPRNNDQVWKDPKTTKQTTGKVKQTNQELYIQPRTHTHTHTTHPYPAKKTGMANSALEHIASYSTPGQTQPPQPEEQGKENDETPGQKRKRPAQEAPQLDQATQHGDVDKCWAHLAALWTLGTWTLRLDYGLVD